MMILDLTYFQYCRLDKKWHPYIFKYAIYVPDKSNPHANRECIGCYVEDNILPRHVKQGYKLSEDAKSYDAPPAIKGVFADRIHACDGLIERYRDNTSIVSDNDIDLMTGTRVGAKLMLKVIDKYLSNNSDPEVLKDDRIESYVEHPTVVDKLIWNIQWHQYRKDIHCLIAYCKFLLRVVHYVPEGCDPDTYSWRDLLITQDQDSDDAVKEVAKHLTVFLKNTTDDDAVYPY